MKLIEHTTTIEAPPTTPGGGRGRGSENHPTASPAAIGALLVGRTFGFALFQTLIAAYYAAAGVADPWSRSVAWWPWTAIITSAHTRGAALPPSARGAPLPGHGAHRALILAG